MSHTERLAWISLSCCLAACSGRSIELESAPLESSSTATLADPCPTLDSYRCSGADYQRCTQTLGGASWITLASCGSDALCGPIGGCVTPACEPDEGVCVGNIVRRCNSDLTGFDEAEMCSGSAFCDPDGCRLAPCDSGAVRCNGYQLERCRVDRTGWDILEVCAPPLRCGRAEQRCLSEICGIGGYRCDGSLLQVCAPDASPNSGTPLRAGWVTLQACTSAELCAAGSARAGCRAPDCAQGELRCSGTTVERCNPSLLGWDMLRECDIGSVCDLEAMDGCRTP